MWFAIAWILVVAALVALFSGVLSGGLYSLVLTAIFFGIPILVYMQYLDHKGRKTRQIELAQAISDPKSDLIPFELFEPGVLKEMEAKHRGRYLDHSWYEQQRAAFEKIGPEIHTAAALMIARWDQRDPERLEELMRTLEPELERLGIRLPPKDSGIMYQRLDQLWRLAKDGRLELAQMGFKSDWRGNDVGIR